jgi:hypothetical protein
MHDDWGDGRRVIMVLENCGMETKWTWYGDGL